MSVQKILDAIKLENKLYRRQFIKEHGYSRKIIPGDKTSTLINPVTTCLECGKPIKSSLSAYRVIHARTVIFNYFCSDKCFLKQEGTLTDFKEFTN